jgi:hypothetical protein
MFVESQDAFSQLVSGSWQVVTTSGCVGKVQDKLDMGVSPDVEAYCIVMIKASAGKLYLEERASLFKEVPVALEVSSAVMISDRTGTV